MEIVIGRKNFQEYINEKVLSTADITAMIDSQRVVPVMNSTAHNYAIGKPLIRTPKTQITTTGLVAGLSATGSVGNNIQYYETEVVLNARKEDYINQIKSLKELIDNLNSQIEQSNRILEMFSKYDLTEINERQELLLRAMKDLETGKDIKEVLASV